MREEIPVTGSRHVGAVGAAFPSRCHEPTGAECRTVVWEGSQTAPLDLYIVNADKGTFLSGSLDALPQHQWAGHHHPLPVRKAGTS